MEHNTNAKDVSRETSPSVEEEAPSIPFRAVQFIHVPAPGGQLSSLSSSSSAAATTAIGTAASWTSSDNNRAAINAHATRSRHARRREARTLAYQASRQGGVVAPPTPEGQSQQQQQQQQLLPASFAARGGGSGNNRSPGIAGLFSAGVMGYVSPTTGVGGPGRSDPFTTFARAFTPLEHFLFDHYLAHIVPRMKAECGELQSLPSPQADAMTARWVRLAQTSADFLDGVLLNAARHLSVMHGMQAQPAERQRYADVAVRYKLACVRAVSAAIVRERRPARYDDVVVAGTMVLAFDEVLLGDLDMSRRHVQGATRMIELNGGPQTLGLNGFLAMLVDKYVAQVGLVTPPGGVSGADY